MKPFFWKFVLCIVPCLLAGWVTTDATIKYRRGDSGGFKLGVDLVGGTILVYEIDLRKSQDTDDKSKFDPAKDTATLAGALKRRIDPNDLYNITIRPAGGEGRVEIILPTGGAHRARKSDLDWENLLNAMKKDLPDSSEKLEVGRGKIQELADLIQNRQVEKQWREKLFNNKEAWDRLLNAGLKYWARMQNTLEVDPPKLKRYKSLPIGDLNKFSEFVVDHLAEHPRFETTTKTVQNWVKKQAWEETLERVRSEYKFSADHEADMSRIVPDNMDQLTTYVLSKGVIISQSALALIKPLVGEHLDRVFEGKDDPTDAQVREFVRKIYGKPLQEIKQDISKYMEKTGFTKDLSVEEVQRIKDLVSKVGSLEFNILANSNDDEKAIKDTITLVNNLSKDELAELQTKGLPPPVPRNKLDGGKTAPLPYTINTSVPGLKSTVTYRWIELGPQERRSLNLDNLARIDPNRNATRTFATTNKDKAQKYPEVAGSTDRFLLQGALFFCRLCNDSNLPEEERKRKEFEYFVLAREPEFTNESAEVRTPKIDGSYLQTASRGNDIQPTVSFVFNNRGGELFGELTRKNVSEGSGPENTQKRRHLAIVLDGMVMSAPTINSQIRTQGQISGNFTLKEVDELVRILREGRLPATLKQQPVSESTIAATLGEDTIASGVQAVLLAFAAVLAFMCVYYRFAGVVASLALLANLLLTVGFMVAVQATFTLSGLAGIVLTLGMAVDANVLIYERLREERERGASLLQAIRNGYDRALPTIIDTHLSSIFTAIVLYVVGNDNLKGFAISMTVGLVISLFTSLYMTRVMFDYWQSKGWLTNLTMMRLFAKPNLDFMTIRNVMFAITLFVSIGGAALFIGRLPNDLNIDFVGGTAYGGKLTTGLTVKLLRDQVDEKRQKKVLADVVVTEEKEKSQYSLTYPNGDKSKLTVTFANAPDGKTPEERIASVKKRAMHLPDPSVELLYNATEDKAVQKELSENKSRNFVIRTTEKEPELVQTMLDQLLRIEDKDGSTKPLLDKAYMSFTKLLAEDGKTKSETVLKFYGTEEDARKGNADKVVTASPSFVKTLFNRELRREFGLTDDKEPLPFVLEVAAEGSSDSDGKFKSMRVGFGSSVLPVEHAAKVDEALKHTQEAFSRRPLPDRLENFDSALANETRYRAMWAVLASWAAILVYLWFRFGNWTFGLAAVLCLIHDLFFTLGAVAACHFVHGTFIGDLLRLDDFKLDLPSVAALLTLVGYSVNDTIVVFDRIREVRGKNPDLSFKMINDSVNQTLSRTVLASLTVWLVVVVLYIFGGPGVHLFAFVMVIGVLVGTYSSIYIAAPLLVIFGEGKHDDEIAGTKPAAPAPTAEGAVV